MGPVPSRFPLALAFQTGKGESTLLPSATSCLLPEPIFHIISHVKIGVNIGSYLGDWQNSTLVREGWILDRRNKSLEGSAADLVYRDDGMGWK